ncbi:MAG: isoaspartyl peptidase/L-asparaginase [Chlorobiota bacterium]
MGARTITTGTSRMSRWLILVHGGAGDLAPMTPEMEQSYRQALREAVRAGMDVLAAGGSSTDAVTAAVTVLEDCGLFNAGRGSAPNAEGTIEMDAAVMEGRSRRAGAVAAVRRLRNPVVAAQLVAEHSPHVLLCGSGAETFALQHGAESVAPDYFCRAAANESNDTVGAVALDVYGNLAAATSTGGTVRKLPGRVGDSPLIGAGTYADNRSCAVSTTGIGEFFIRTVAAYSVHARMLWGGLSISQAAYETLQEVAALGGSGGLIGIDLHGNTVALCTTSGMYRGMGSSDRSIWTALFRDEPWQRT